MEELKIKRVLFTERILADKLIYKLNQKLLSDGFVSVADYYYAAGVVHISRYMDPDSCDIYGWLNLEKAKVVKAGGNTWEVIMPKAAKITHVDCRESEYLTNRWVKFIRPIYADHELITFQIGGRGCGKSIKLPYSLTNLEFSDKNEARRILAHLKGLLRKGVITVADYYSAAAYAHLYRDTIYGWSNLDGVFVEPSKNGWKIGLPTPHRLGAPETAVQEEPLSEYSCFDLWSSTYNDLAWPYDLSFGINDESISVRLDLKDSKYGLLLESVERKIDKSDLKYSAFDVVAHTISKMKTPTASEDRDVDISMYIIKHYGHLVSNYILDVHTDKETDELWIQISRNEIYPSSRHTIRYVIGRGIPREDVTLDIIIRTILELKDILDRDIAKTF